MTRRAALKGTAAALACAMMWNAGRAWAGVGGGDWGCNDAVAAPGNYFGHDGGWAYSSDGTCWISLSANCTIGRMTELYLNVTVKAYFANGGVWSPTWFTDFPDTHVRTFVWNATGGYDEDSHTGFYDTTYDSNSYHGPYCEITHRVSRKSSDWRCHPGAQVWCDSADNANGIWTQEYGRQVIPHHVLVNDDFWIGKIVTLRALSSPERYADVTAGGAEGTGVVTWSPYDASNQNWGVGRSAQGRCCFVPIHLAHQTYLDLRGGDWNDRDEFQIYGGNGSLAQSFWLHKTSARAARTSPARTCSIPECSGCAMDNRGCGTRSARPSPNGTATATGTTTTSGGSWRSRSFGRRRPASSSWPASTTRGTPSSARRSPPRASAAASRCPRTTGRPRASTTPTGGTEAPPRSAARS